MQVPGRVTGQKTSHFLFLIAMVSELLAMASNLLVLASNLIGIASNSNLLRGRSGDQEPL